MNRALAPSAGTFGRGSGRSAERTLSYAIRALAFWTAIGIIFALPDVAALGGWKAFSSSLAEWWSWGLLAPAILAIDRRLSFQASWHWQRLGVQLLVAAGVAVAYVYVLAVLAAALRIAPWSGLDNGQPVKHALHGMYLWDLVVYGLILGVGQAYRYRERSRTAELEMERLERSFADARLHSLRMQLDPHFLFNALNTISSQVERQPELARSMIEHLGDLLRSSLGPHSRQEVLLSEEVEFLAKYLAIQKIRFGEALDVRLEIEPGAECADVPSLFMQPLVENAIRHGLSPRIGGGVVTVTAKRNLGRLDVTVSDDGVGLPPEWSWEANEGLGLSVTRERILSLHPDGSTSIDVRPRPEGGTSVHISFPFRRATDTP